MIPRVARYSPRLVRLHLGRSLYNNPPLVHVSLCSLRRCRPSFLPFVCLYRPFLPPFLLSIRMMPIQGYIKPLRSTGMLANKSISAIFSNVETLLKYAAPLSLGSVRHELFTVIRHTHMQLPHHLHGEPPSTC